MLVGVLVTSIDDQGVERMAVKKERKKLVWWRWPAELDPMLQIVAKVVAKERPHWEGIVHDLEKMVIKM